MTTIKDIAERLEFPSVPYQKQSMAVATLATVYARPFLIQLLRWDM